MGPSTGPGATSRRTTALAAAIPFAALLLNPIAERAHAQAVLGGDWRVDVDRFAESLVEAGLTPGLSVAVAAGDWVVHAAGYGTTDLATGRAVGGDTPFYIASTTKSLTALAVALAAERGDLDLAAPIERYLPDVRLPDGVDFGSITVEELLLMRHGLAGSGPVVLLTAFIGEDDRDRLAPLLRHHAPTGGEGFSYNNLGYNLLGLILEARYGESWKDVVCREVLDPLGMERTTAYRSRLDGDRIALPHAASPDGFARMRLAKDDANLHAAGGHFAAARDLARYLAAHLSGGVVEGRRLLPEAPVMATHVSRIDQDRDFGPYHRHGWGYGWDVGTFEGDTLLHRFGGFGGYFSHVSFMPHRRVGVVVLVNGESPAGAAGTLMANYVYHRLRGLPGLERRYAGELDSLVSRAGRAREALAEHLAERRARLAPLPRPLAGYAGVYESPMLGRMEWREVAGGLEVRLGVIHSRAEVFDAGAEQLRIEVGGSGVVVTFEGPEAGGPATSVSLAGTTFERVEPALP